MDSSGREQILQELRRRDPQAAFVTEIAASLRPAPVEEDLAEAIDELHRQRMVIVTDHPAPDIHLATTDLRIVARVPEPENELAAQEAAESLWNRWLQMFFSTHRCQ